MIESFLKCFQEKQYTFLYIVLSVIKWDPINFDLSVKKVQAGSVTQIPKVRSSSCLSQYMKRLIFNSRHFEFVLNRGEQSIVCTLYIRKV